MMIKRYNKITKIYKTLSSNGHFHQNPMAHLAELKKHIQTNLHVIYFTEMQLIAFNFRIFKPARVIKSDLDPAWLESNQFS